MFDASAAFYDELYSFRNFRTEANQALSLARAATMRQVHSVLDLGCATGDHAAAMAAGGMADVWGVDVDRRLVRQARQKHPKLRLRVADMLTMRLGRVFDAILCLYGVAAYARTPPRLRTLARNVTRHLSPGGVAVIQPWHMRGEYVPGPTARVVELPHVRIARAAAAVVRGHRVVLKVAYVVERGGTLVASDETHQLGLFSAQEYRDALIDAGLRVRWTAKGPGGHRGAIVAVKPMSARR